MPCWNIEYTSFRVHPMAKRAQKFPWVINRNHGGKSRPRSLTNVDALTRDFRSLVVCDTDYYKSTWLGSDKSPPVIKDQATVLSGNMARLQPIFWFGIIFSCFVMASTAPAAGKRRAHVIGDQTKVSTIFSALSGEEKVLSRSRRHVPVDAVTSELLAAIDADSSATSLQRRQRRSAVFYLTASMQFCKNYPIYCRRIEVDEGDVKVKIRLAEE